VRSRVLFLIAALLSGSAAIHSQGSSPGQNPTRLEVNVVQVPLLVTVTDNKGQLITTLNKESFRLYEGSRLQKIDSFSRESNVPLSIALLVDQSSSTIDQLEFERAAAMDFFNNTVKRGKDRAMIIGFASNAEELVDFTDNPEKFADGLRKLSAGGGTAVYDTLFVAAREKLAQEDGERRKVIILISDGDDTASRYSLAQALTTVQKNDAIIYAISVNRTTSTKNADRERGDKAIRQMVDETGGRAYFPTKLSELTAEFKKIEDELRSQYSLSYTPANPFDGTYRKLRVDMVDRKHKARTRAGYIAAKD
jgi:VWFA-related protein